jgi:hypothetical protein
VAIARTFNKINGQEAGQLTVQTVQTALDRDDNFRQHLTFLEFTIEVEIRGSYVAGVGDPRQEYRQVISTGRTLVEQGPDGQIVSAVPANAPRTVFEITRLKSQHSALTEAPDALRREHGLYVPTPQMDQKSGVIVDIPGREVEAEQKETEETNQTRRAATWERDREMARRGVQPIHLDALPVQELARDVDDQTAVEVRHDINRAERIPTELPAEHVVTE